MPINRVARKSAIADELSVFLFFFFFPVSSMLFRKGRHGRKKDTGEKKKKGKKEEKERGGGKTGRRGGKKNRRVNCFPAANGRQLKLKILDYLHRAFTYAYTRRNEKQMLRVDRVDLVTTDSSQKSRNQYIRERARWASKIVGFQRRQGVRLGQRRWGGRVGYGTSGRLSQFPDFNIDGCRESARVIQCVNFRPVF